MSFSKLFIHHNSFLTFTIMMHASVHCPNRRDSPNKVTSLSLARFSLPRPHLVNFEFLLHSHVFPVICHLWCPSESDRTVTEVDQASLFFIVLPRVLDIRVSLEKLSSCAPADLSVSYPGISKSGFIPRGSTPLVHLL